MTAAKELWSKHVGGVNTPPSPMSVIVTSESKQVLREQANYSFHQPSSLHADSFPIRFVTNHLDVFQDTGYLKDVINTNIAPFTADQAMLSAISSLKLQLLTRVTLGNCCSNFHLLLKDLLDTGCGATIENSFQCLQDDENPEFRVCCAWDRSPLCQARRKQRKEN